MIISNELMKYIMKLVKYLEDSGLLIKGVSETIENKAEEQKGRFLIMLLGILGASLLRHLLQVKQQQQRVEKQLEHLVELYEHVMK